LKAAPEQDAEKLQTFDTWSYGCVLSVAATWIVIGVKGVANYENHRQKACQKVPPRGKMAAELSDQFHDGKRVHVEIKAWHDQLRNAMRSSDFVTSQILELVENHLLLEDPKTRLDSTSLYQRLTEIIGTAERFWKTPEAQAIYQWSAPKIHELNRRLLQQNLQTAYTPDTWSREIECLMPDTEQQRHTLDQAQNVRISLLISERYRDFVRAGHSTGYVNVEINAPDGQQSEFMLHLNPTPRKSAANAKSGQVDRQTSHRKQALSQRLLGVRIMPEPGFGTSAQETFSRSGIQSLRPPSLRISQNASRQSSREKGRQYSSVVVNPSRDHSDDDAQLSKHLRTRTVDRVSLGPRQIDPTFSASHSSASSANFIHTPHADPDMQINDTRPSKQNRPRDTKSKPILSPLISPTLGKDEPNSTAAYQAYLDKTSPDSYVSPSATTTASGLGIGDLVERQGTRKARLSNSPSSSLSGQAQEPSGYGAQSSTSPSSSSFSRHAPSLGSSLRHRSTVSDSADIWTLVMSEHVSAPRFIRDLLQREAERAKEKDPSTGQTPIMVAARHLDFIKIDELLLHSDLNAEDLEQKTVLHHLVLACSRNTKSPTSRDWDEKFHQILESILDMSRETPIVGMLDHHGRPALFYCCSRDGREMIKTIEHLVKAEGAAQPSASPSTRVKVLQEAVKYAPLSVLKALEGYVQASDWNNIQDPGTLSGHKKAYVLENMPRKTKPSRRNILFGGRSN
jgi:hypothetical protein